MFRSPTAVIHILLVNNTTLIRSSLKLLLEGQPNLKVIAEAGSKAEALRLAQQEQPDIILLDPNLTGSTGLDIIPELLAASNTFRLLIITSEDDSQFFVQAVQLGAMGVVSMQQTPEILFKAIEKVHAGEIWLDRSLVANVIYQMSRGGKSGKSDPDDEKIARLSHRERQVIELIGEGLKNQQIADRLFLSEVTVRHHLTSVFKKLDLTNRLDLVLYAYRKNLAKPPD